MSNTALINAAREHALMISAVDPRHVVLPSFLHSLADALEAAPTRTGFLDAAGTEILAGHIVRFPLKDPFTTVHGAWAEKRIVFRNGVWMAEYWRSEAGQVMPVGYSVGELAEWREYKGTEWVFAEHDHYRTVTGTIVEATA